MQYEDLNIEKIVHATFKITHGEIKIYIDPFTNNGEIDYFNMPKADYILITHEHYDHCDKEAIKNLMGEGTIVIGNEKVKETLADIEVFTVNQYADEQFDDFKLETVPAYNTNKFRAENEPYHPRENGGVGYILKIGDVRIYHTGDTDFIEEMKQIKDIDVMLTPMSGTYVMTPTEALDAVKTIKPKVAFPMHYAAIVGGESELDQFQQLMSGSEIEIVRS